MAYQLFVVRGRLLDIMDVRSTKNGWKIRDFVVEIDSGSPHVQTRIFQAVKEAVDVLSFVPIGSEVEMRFMLRGRRYKRPGDEHYRYYNIDEVHHVSLMKRV